MTFRDFMLLFAVCLVWGLNLVVTRWVVTDLAVPPLFFAALRWKDWKLVTNEGPMIVNTPRTNTSNCACSLVANAGSSYLFNLASDRNESVDVKDQRPDIYTKMVAKLHRYYTGAAKSAWRPEAKDLAYANWNLAENFVVPWLGNVSYHLADAPDKLVFSH